MGTYVSGEKLERLFAKEAIQVSGEQRLPWIKAIQLVRSVDDENVAPRDISEWEWTGDTTANKREWRCVRCNEIVEKYYLFCPCCGRKMR